MSKASVAPPSLVERITGPIDALILIEASANLVAGKLRALCYVAELLADDEEGFLRDLVKEALVTQAAKVAEISACAFQGRARKGVA